MTASHDPETETLVSEDLPTAFQQADRVSLEGQRRMLRWTSAYLTLLVLASIGGAVPGRLGGACSLVAFLGALMFVIRLATEQPATTWYRGRAGAESIKTLAWKYAVGGDPFELDGKADRDVDLLFADGLREVIEGLSDLNWAAGGRGTQISARMREVRTWPLERRKEIYAGARIDDQQAWYDDRAGQNRRKAERWVLVALGGSFAGVMGGLARALGFTPNIDFLSVLATFAASATAWAQTKQFRILATSYAVAAQELATISIRLPHIETEQDWSTFVSDAELAISREHTLWLTRRALIV